LSKVKGQTVCRKTVGQKPLRLIVIESSANDTALILHELKKAGFSPEHVVVDTVYGLQEALKNNCWQLIIADHRLPGFNVSEVLDILQGSCSYLPLIICSGVIDEETVLAALKAGVRDCVSMGNLSCLGLVVARALAEAELKKEHTMALRALQDSEKRFIRLAENARDIIYRLQIGHPLKFDYISPSAEAITGYSPSEYYNNAAMGQSIIHPDDFWIMKAIKEGKLGFEKPFLIRWLHKRGKVIWLEQQIAPVRDDLGELVILEVIARDVTERLVNEAELKKSHARIEALTNRVLTAMEEERARLARELHDELGQALTAVKLDLQLLDDLLSKNRKYKKYLGQSIDLVSNTIKLVRRQSGSLRPPRLDEMGLLPALEEMIDGFSKRTGIQCKLDCGDFSERFPTHVEIALYRCIQESLTNVARHACAKKVEVKLAYQDQNLSVVVNDDGIGFNPELTEISTKHIGVIGMKERVRLLSGSFAIKSKPGLGTTVIIELPYLQTLDRMCMQ
jgi:two-component system, NarL family, sensor histidine kinase UhpB